MRYVEREFSNGFGELGHFALCEVPPFGRRVPEIEKVRGIAFPTYSNRSKFEG